MEFNEIIAFTGGINTDDTPQGVPKGDYRDFAYCRLGYNSGNAYAVETSDGTLLIPNPDIELQDQIIGATQWLKQNSIVYFVFKADLNHQIWVYNIEEQTHTAVVTDPVLNFSREWPIFHANVIDDILKWTDGRWDVQMYEADGTRLFNPPYQINLQKALDGYYTVVDLQTIDAIKWPMDPPRVAYFTDPTRNDNKLRNKLFKFIIQPIYENGEVGVWSMYSNLELPEQSELIPGANWIYPNNSNGINIQFETGPEIIRKFNIAVQQFDKDAFGAEPPFGVFLQLDKDQDSIPSNTIYTVQFYGGVATVPAIDVFKNYDRLPITASCQEYLPTSQIVYTNFREGYDKPTEEPFILNVGVDYQLNEINWNPFAAIDLDITYDFASSSIITDTDDFNANDIFPFSAGLVLQGPAPTSASISQFFYQITQADIDAALAAGATAMDWNIAIMNIICNSFMSQLGYPPVSSAAALGNAVRYTFTAGANVDGVFNPRVRSYRQTLSAPSLKVGVTHEFGIVYGDRAYRDGTVYTIDSMNLFVPWFYDLDRSGLSNTDNPFTINARFTIDHIPPVWADRYWIVAKPATEISSFGQYTTNANDISLINNVGGSGYVSSIYLDTVTNNRYIINIDKYYVNQNIGASIAHEIKVGDKIRFIRRRLDGPATTADQVPYLPYLELDVIGYDPVGGEQQRQIVYTNIFDTGLIETQAGLDSVEGQLFGQLIEIYTPTPSIDDTGSLFVSTWKDVTEAIDIRNPHTEDRAHGAPPLYYVYITGDDPYFFYMNGDYTFLEGNTYSITIHNIDGTTSSASSVVNLASYQQSSNQTRLSFAFSATSSIAYITIDTDPFAAETNEYQISNDLDSSRPATFALSYGDVYVKQRNYQTGMAGGSAQAYYFIEDPNYSDYWPSNIHETGRTRIEDLNAKMTHRQATAIHSDSFIVGTQINGLSSFSLLNDNIEDMNPAFGPVVRTYMSGREGKTLKCLQPKKENSIYIQFYPNEVGSDSTVRVSNRTFASWFDYKTLFGCSDAGATAILPDGTTMYFDNNAGVFMYSGGNGQTVVSEIDPDTGKDYKFRTKTKQLAASYNSTTIPVVRTYVNETVGEVGFAFRFGNQYTGQMQGGFNPPFQPNEVWVVVGVDAEYLYGLEIVVVHENGAVYTGVVTQAIWDEGLNYTTIQINNAGPSASEFNIPAYYYTTSGFTYDHVVFDYVNMRWRSTYDYNFQQFCNLGQTLVGWGVNNQMYLHNEYGNWDFHGDPFIQKISFVSNENPLALKRYQDITLVSDDTFSVEAYSEPNRSYPLGMKTTMPTNIINVYEGYGKTYYRKNLYDPRFFGTGTSTVSNYDPPNALPVNGWLVPGDQQGLLAQNITIIQNDGTIFSGDVVSAVYSIPDDNTLIVIADQGPSSFGVNGYWYNSDRAMLNGEDVRANALTHNLYFDASLADQSSILFSVGIKGVLS